MKRLLYLILLFPLLAFAQQDTTTTGLPTGGTQIGGLTPQFVKGLWNGSPYLYWYFNGRSYQIPNAAAISKNLVLKTPYVADTTALKTFNRNNTLQAIVSDPVTGGLFAYKPTLPAGVKLDGVGAFQAADGGYYVRQFAGAVHTAWAGVKSSLSDATGLIQKVINNYGDIYIDSGRYNVKSLIVPDGRVINGYKKVDLKQLSGTTGQSIINITGSKFLISGIRVIGNVTTETGEQNHGIKIQATSTTGNIISGRVIDFTADSCRGDGIYIGGGFAVNTPLPQNIYCENIIANYNYRNGGSITSGINIQFNNVIAIGNGLKGFDIENNANNIKTIRISGLKTSTFSTVGTATAPATDITIDGYILDYKYRLNAPVIYPGSDFSLKVGFAYRNTRDLKAINGTIKNMPQYAISSVYAAGTDVFSDNIRFDGFYTDSCATDAGLLGVINPGAVRNGVFENGKSVLPAGETVRAHFFNNTGYKYTVRNVTTLNGRVAYQSYADFEHIHHPTGAIAPFNLIAGSTVTYSTINVPGQTLLSNSTGILFQSDSLNYATRTTSGGTNELNTFINNYENGTFITTDYGTTAINTSAAAGTIRYNTNATAASPIYGWYKFNDGTVQTLYLPKDYPNISNTWTKQNNFNGLLNASSGLGYNLGIYGTVVAQADNDILVGLDVNNTLNGNGKAGTTSYDIRSNKGVQFDASGLLNSGTVVFGTRRASPLGVGEFRGTFRFWNNASSLHDLGVTYDATNNNAQIGAYSNNVLERLDIFNPYFPNITSGSGTDNILTVSATGQVRFISPTSLGVSSFNGRTGAVSPIVGDYSAFYVQPTNTLSGAGTGVNFVTNATQTGNNQAFYGVTFNNPTVTTGGFTGATMYALRSVGQALFNSSVTVGAGASISGTSTLQALTIGYNGSAATSTTTQRNSFAIALSAGLFDGTSSLTKYTGVANIASTTVNGAYKTTFYTNSTSATNNTSGNSDQFNLFSSGAVGLLGASSDPGAGNIAIGTSLPTTTNQAAVLAVDAGLLKTVNLTNTNSDNFVGVGVNTTLTYDPNVSMYLLTGSKMVVNLPAASNYYSGGTAKRLAFVNNSTEYNTISTSGTDLFNVAGNSGQTLIIPARSTLILSAINSSTFAPLQMTGFSYGIPSATNITLTFGQEYQATNNSGQTFTLPPALTNAVGKNYSITINNISSGTVTINSNAGGNDIRVSTTLVSSDTIVSGAVVTYTPYFDGSVTYYKRQ